MPTYDYRCSKCGATGSVVQSISTYSRSPIRLTCCEEEMARKLSVSPLMGGLANAMAGDRHYDGLRAPDGSDISSRTKHREYMKRTGLTSTSDFTEVWKKDAEDRKALQNGTFEDKEMNSIVTEQVMRAVAQPN